MTRTSLLGRSLYPFLGSKISPSDDKLSCSSQGIVGWLPIIALYADGIFMIKVNHNRCSNVLLDASKNGLDALLNLAWQDRSHAHSIWHCLVLLLCFGVLSAGSKYPCYKLRQLPSLDKGLYLFLQLYAFIYIVFMIFVISAIISSISESEWFLDLG